MLPQTILPPSNRLHNYELGKVLGSGNYAFVRYAINKTTKNECAIKAIDNNKIKAQSKVLELLKSEINILTSLNHQNVVKLYEAFYENDKYYLVLEYCNQGDLQQFIRKKKNKKISEEEALGYLKQLLNGFKALHNVNAMHRDLKLANILIHDGVLKIADLGFSKQATLAKTSLGTTSYMAPEVYYFQKYDKKIDIFSLGVCLYEMLYGELPFFGKDEDETYELVKKNEINFNSRGVKISEELQELIRKMLKFDPKERISWVDLYNHEILNKKPEKIDSLEEVSKPLNKDKLLDKATNHLFEEGKKFYEKKNSEMNVTFAENGDQNVFIDESKYLISQFQKKKESEEEEEKLEIPPPLLENKISVQLEKEAQEKKDSLLRLENKYLHLRNIIAFHAKVWYDGYKLSKSNNSIYIYFILAKRLLYLSKDLLQGLEEKNNRFKEKYFEDFQLEGSYQRIQKIHQTENWLFVEHYKILLEDIQKYKTAENSLYLKLKSEFNHDYANIDDLFREILADFVLNGENLVKSEKKEENAKKLAKHLSQLVDCFKYEQIFNFRENEEAGFDFEKYEEDLDKRDLEKLIHLFSEKIALIF